VAAAFEAASGKRARSRRPPMKAFSNNKIRVQYAVAAVAPASRYVIS